jgi:acetyl esterase
MKTVKLPSVDGMTSETRASYELLKKFSWPDYSQISITEYRKLAGAYKEFASKPDSSVSIKEELVRYKGVQFNYKVFTPPNLASSQADALVWYPGGGFIAHLDAHDGLCSHLAVNAKAKVFLLETLLAPEYKFPHSTHHAQLFAEYIFKEAVSLNLLNISIGGDSSGGNFALSSALYLAANTSYQCKRVLLANPVVDLSHSNDQFTAYEKLNCLPNDLIERMYSDYLPDKHDRADPGVSLVFANLSVLANTAVDIFIPEFDAFRNQAHTLHEALTRQGVNNRLVILRGLMHGAIVDGSPTINGKRFEELAFESSL